MRKILLAFVVGLFGVLLSSVGMGCTSILGNFDVGDSGGGDGGGDAKTDAGHDATPGKDAPSGPFTIGGHVTGLSGTGLVLLDNGGNALDISANGPFTFTSPLAQGVTYDVTVGTQPMTPPQTCTVVAGKGKVLLHDVISVDVACTTDFFTISGTVSHLAKGDVVVLEDNGTDQLTVSTNGPFTFKTKVLGGGTYSVTIQTQPSGSTDTCYVSGPTSTGTVSADVTNVAVTCSDCGRFSTGVTAKSWNTVAVNPFADGMFMSEYLPPGPATGPSLYVFDSNTMSADSFNAATNVYTALSSPFTSFAGYSSFAWYNNSLWSMQGANVVEYEISSATWLLPSSALAAADTETTVDNAGNLWGFQSESVLGGYNVASGVLTPFTLPTPMAGDMEPRVVYDGCSELLYLTDFLATATAFYSYDPATNTQTMLSPLPSSNLFQDGFCSDRSGHIFVIDNGATPFQYTIATDTWIALPAGPVGDNNSACGVGADGNLYATDPNVSGMMMYQIPIE
jgi:hypothetical protein